MKTNTLLITPNPSILAHVALTLDKLSIHYTVEFSPAEALFFVSRADAYNDFSKQDLTRFIERVNEIIPRMNYGGINPNNGNPFHKFDIGNEGSRVIYVKIVKGYLREHTAQQWAAMISSLQSNGKRAHADEIHVVENADGFIKLRFCWD
jgi:hypothetical protein